MGEMRYRWAEFLMRAVYESQGFDVIHNGAPDLILLKDRRIQFVEIKTKNDSLKAEQKRAIELLKKHGFTARKEEIALYKNHDEPGYHKIRSYRAGAGNNRVFHMFTERLMRIVNKKRQ